MSVTRAYVRTGRKHRRTVTRRRYYPHLRKTDIEVFFKACKSYLNLVKEYRGISYDAMNAHVAIVFSRYMMLSVARRKNEDDRTICELCFCLLDEMEDISFSRSIYRSHNGVFPYHRSPAGRILIQLCTLPSPVSICRRPWNGGNQPHEGILWTKVLIFQGANHHLRCGKFQ